MHECVWGMMWCVGIDTHVCCAVWVDAESQEKRLLSMRCTHLKSTVTPISANLSRDGIAADSKPTMWSSSASCEESSQNRQQHDDGLGTNHMHAENKRVSGRRHSPPHTHTHTSVALQHGSLRERVNMMITTRHGHRARQCPARILRQD